ncbi:AAA family ATPase [Niabella drilacis]|uniref:Nicotinamide-nucleotide adenylyltransferase, NadR type n=1 Tax=Niabella drilacis (strain DSM 25811 / CCM 8410 / CCUG 62505 / LMG 26954 / E90) TaxID=1285928 RepID=A0A1G6N9T0_NIADE|nr:AAA family ATPase [Niabella drilacis]SDC64184.1 nicotinamide-nucleotide adenylyltransferase, NadR type [Niabella drilacis]
MTRGLVIGKFMPLHKGHIALIKFAAWHCDELIVSMSYSDNDPIDGTLRFSWILEQFSADPKIKPHIIKDDFDDETLPLEDRTRIWAQKMKAVYPPIQVLISSEPYGAPFARHMNAQHICFDLARGQVPVSATAIRNRPLTNWDFIPRIIQPYFIKKICLYGPESTGKTTLAIKMARHYHTVYVPEAARDLLASNEFSAADIVAIGQLQHQYIQEQSQKASRLLFCDTDAVTTAIYSRLYLNHVPPEIYELEKRTRYDLHLLLDIDTPWVADPLRDQGHRREEMLLLFEQALQERQLPYIKISGSYPEREIRVKSIIDQLLRSG